MNNNCFSIFFKTFFILFITFTNVYSLEERKTFAYLVEGVIDIKKNNSNNIIKILIDEAFEKEELNFDVKVYNNYNTFFKDLKNNKISLFNMQSFEYIKHKKELDPLINTLWAVSHNKKHSFVRYYLLSNKSNNIYSLKDLKNKKIALVEFNNWAKMFLKENYNKSNLSSVKSESLAVLDTYFGKFDACVITSNTYEAMLELNPSLKNNIRIVKKSERIFLRHLVLVSTNNSPKELALINKTIGHFNNFKAKDDIFSLFEVNNMKLAKKEELRDLHSYYKKNLSYINELNE